MVDLSRYLVNSIPDTTLSGLPRVQVYEEAVTQLSNGILHGTPTILWVSISGSIYHWAAYPFRNGFNTRYHWKAYPHNGFWAWKAYPNYANGILSGQPIVIVGLSLPVVSPVSVGASLEIVSLWIKETKDQKPQRMTDCPQCGYEPLRERNGILYCPFDGWTSNIIFDRIAR